MCQYSMATLYDRGVGTIQKDDKEAFRGFERSARNGCRLALARLGLCYLRGKGTAIDRPKAMECLKNAAKEGVPLAMGILGECYEKGEDLAQDLAEAARWYRRGAECDPVVHAQPAELYDFRNGAGACRAELGACYEEGKGVDKNLQEALNWYQSALRLGFYHVESAIKRVEDALKASEAP